MTTAESDRGAAAARAELARRRINELQQRRTELAAGQPASPSTVERARVHVLESLHRVERAHRDAAARHLDAAAAHRRAAATHEQAALQSRDSSAHQDAAAAHRAAAARHNAASTVENGHAAQVWASISSNAPDTPPSWP